MAARQRPQRGGKAGFALPMVLGMVTVLALIFLVCMAGLRSLQAETRATLSDVEFERTAMTAEARMAFLAVTEPFVLVRTAVSRQPRWTFCQPR